MRAKVSSAEDKEDECVDLAREGKGESFSQFSASVAVVVEGKLIFEFVDCGFEGCCEECLSIFGPGVRKLWVRRSIMWPSR